MDNIGRMYPIDYPAHAPEQYGVSAPSIREFYVDLSTARDKLQLAFGGRYLWAYRGSSATCSVSIQLGDQFRDGITFTRGMQFAGIPFSEIYLTNTAQPGQYLYFLITDAQPTVLNPEVTFSSVILSKSTVLTDASDVTVVAGAAAAVILAANSARRTALISSLLSNAQNCRVGGANTGASRGTELAPGGCVEVETTAAIYAYNPAGVNVDLTVAWTED